MNQLLLPDRARHRALHLAMACGVVIGGGAVAGCGSPAVPIEDKPDTTIIGPFLNARNIDKVDLLLMLDNSRSMADKQLILAVAVPDLVSGLLNPKCVDSTGSPADTQPSGPLESCLPGTRRAFPPITDIHVGIITSSLGGHGADTCSVPGDTQSCSEASNPSNNDAGHLVSRRDVCGGTTTPTYGGNKGFLAWDPEQKLSPPGEGQLGAITTDAFGTTTTLTPGLVPTLKDLVVGVGQVGCGFSSQMESWYRFLVDPDPYQTISIQNGQATPTGTDTLLLEERANFLRPSSLLAIVMVTDGNDCSIKESGQFYFAAQQHKPDDPTQSYHLPRARKECATNPDDPCCKPCDQPAGACPVDDGCAADPTLSAQEDDINLRCFDQKRRFGIDFLYPVDRYTNALRSPMVPNRQGDMVVNPIFDPRNTTDANPSVRDTSLVFLAGVVGVPWQDIARTDGNGNPDPTAGFKSAGELAIKDANGISAWDKILGDPKSHVLPKDLHMIESATPRAGLPGPTSPVGTDPINGHEYTTSNADLEYACIFALPAPRDCSGGASGCDCNAASDSPLCDPSNKTTQLRAKAYPGLRELSTLESLGEQGIVASVCPVQLWDSTRADYGYRAALGAILDRLKSHVDGGCLAQQLTPDPHGVVSCTIVEARNAGGACSCDPIRARRAVTPEHQGIIAAINASPSAKDAAWNCFCELVEAGDPTVSTPEELAACIGDPSEAPVVHGGKDDGKAANGWCYVDPSQSSKASDEIVKDCPATEKRVIRFVGDSAENGTATLFISCSGDGP
jgi:hypothetical protein